MFEKLLSDVRTLKLPPGSYALFGSAPILVRGLREASNDLDLIIRPETWGELAVRPELTRKTHESGREYLEWEGHNIELYPFWQPGEWGIAKLIDDAELIDGLPYVRLETVLAWKQRLARPKDVRDIALIEAFFDKQQKP